MHAPRRSDTTISMAMESVLAEFRNNIEPVVSPDDSIEQCRRILETSNISVVIVIDPSTQKPIGKVDSLSLITALKRKTKPLTWKARDFMGSCEAYLASPKRPHEALTHMEMKNLPFLIIISPEGGDYKGVITRADLHARNTIRLREQDRQMNMVLAEMREEIQDTQKENTEVMGMLAHDLRGPLGGIQGLSSLMSKDCDSLDKRKSLNSQNLLQKNLSTFLNS